MKMNNILKGLFTAVILLLIICGVVTLFRRCDRQSITSTPKQIIKRERVSESADKEIWRTSTYKLHTVEYDTVMKKRSWDTAHELPR